MCLFTHAKYTLSPTTATNAEDGGGVQAQSGPWDKVGAGSVPYLAPLSPLGLF